MKSRINFLPLKAAFREKSISISIFTILISLLSVQAHATASLIDVTITKLNINKTAGNYLFILTSTPPTVVGCQTDNNWNLVLPLDSDLAGKLYAGLLAAQVSQSKVQLQGTGTCTWGIENLNNFTITK